MKSIFISLILFYSISTSSLFAQSEAVKELNPKRFDRTLKLNPDAVLVDIRAKKKFEKAHINGAYSAPNSKILFHLIDSIGSSKDYLLYCSYGKRSVEASKIISIKYRVKVCSLKGGLDSWLKNGFGL